MRSIKSQRGDTHLKKICFESSPYHEIRTSNLNKTVIISVAIFRQICNMIPHSIGYEFICAAQLRYPWIF
jgi:hypothetical protein